MPVRFVPLITGQIYHVYNRGSEKRRIFQEPRNYQRFLKTLTYYQLKGPKPKLSNFIGYKKFDLENAEKIVEIIAYCLMPNHFHLILRQVEDGSITEMMSKTSLSYTKYFNTKYNRVGPLFQGEFKSVLVESDEQLIHLSRYIHLNPIVSYLTKQPGDYKWSSYQEYVNPSRIGICDKHYALGYFSSESRYQDFVSDQIDYATTIELFKHQLIDEED